MREGRFTTGMHRFNHILVDEFQDINPLDLNLLNAIAKANKASLTIVGGDDQAIFEWRGATPQFILNPYSYLGGSYSTCVLETNYRSPRNIVELSQKLIKHNKRRVDKTVNAALEASASVDVLRMSGLSDSVDYVTATVQGLLHDGKLRNISLIGRKRSQIVPYQIVFAGQNVPFYAAEDLHVMLSDAFRDLKEALTIKASVAEGRSRSYDPIQDFFRLLDRVKRSPLPKRTARRCPATFTPATHRRWPGPRMFSDGTAVLSRVKTRVGRCRGYLPMRLRLF